MLSDVIVRADSVSGYVIDQGRSRLAFARNDVVAVQTRELSTIRNVALGVASLAVVAAVAFVVFLTQILPES
jgi:hypothetical protein